MNLKTLSLIAASALIGVTGAFAQASGAAATGTSSNGTAETAARPSTVTTAKLTRGDGPTSNAGMGRKKKHHRSMRHGRRHHHGRHHAMHGKMEKSGTDKATPKPSSNGQ